MIACFTCHCDPDKAAEAEALVRYEMDLHERELDEAGELQMDKDALVDEYLENFETGIGTVENYKEEHPVVEVEDDDE